MSQQQGAMNKRVQYYQVGTIIFRENDPGDRMYIIIEGKVNIRKKTGDKTFKSLIMLKKGDVFGEMAIVEGKTRSATAVAETECKLMVLDQNGFYQLVSENPQFAIKMLKSFSTRLRKADALIEQILGADTDKQVYQGLSEYFRAKKDTDPDVMRGQVDIGNFLKWGVLNMGLSAEAIQESVRTLVSLRVIRTMEGGADARTLMVDAQSMMKFRI